MNEEKKSTLLKGSVFARVLGRLMEAHLPTLATRRRLTCLVDSPDPSSPLVLFRYSTGAEPGEEFARLMNAFDEAVLHEKLSRRY